jgi:hypothetical protein
VWQVSCATVADSDVHQTQTTGTSTQYVKPDEICSFGVGWCDCVGLLVVSWKREGVRPLLGTSQLRTQKLVRMNDTRQLYWAALEPLDALNQRRHGRASDSESSEVPESQLFNRPPLSINRLHVGSLFGDRPRSGPAH